MYSKGHFGLTLLITSLSMIPFGYNEMFVIIIFLSAGLSSLPDIDMELRKKKISIMGKPIEIHHRGRTHSILFALIVGVLFGLLFYYGIGTFLWFGVGFVSGFMGVVCHLIGDTFTYHAFKPLWPFSQKEISLGLCYAGDRSVNEGLMGLGFVGFVLYIILTTR